MESLPESAGTIHGTVVNGTRGNQPLEGAQVVLRAGEGGELVPVAETRTDRNGNFSFEQVPLEPTVVYLPGANHDDMHYPGRRVRLNQNERIAHVKIVAFDATETPCPLVATRHDIEVTVDEQVLAVTEELWISNPTRTTYVGRSMGHGPPVTFWLSIPQNFDRVTFDKEFFGRRFFVVDHRPVTEMPWLPGKQQLRYTYRIPLVESEGQFLRTLDVPSHDVRILVHGVDKQHVSCNLPRLNATDGSLVFAAGSEQLASDFKIDLQITAIPFDWMQYARWGAVVVLALSAGTTIMIPALRRRLSNSRARAESAAVAESETCCLNQMRCYLRWTVRMKLWIPSACEAIVFSGPVALMKWSWPSTGTIAAIIR